MRLNILRRCSQFLLVSLVISAGSSWFAAAQEKVQSKPIDIDKELEVKLPQDRALSYYHYALAKWHEESGDIALALNEMRKAVKYNESSSAARMGLANLLFDKLTDIKEAMAEAQEAERLDPKDPEPHWLLAQIYFRSQGGRDPAAKKEALSNAAKELESMRQDAPDDERAYFALGTAYMELGDVDRAVQVFEKYQSLQPNSTAGYVEIARIYERKNNPEKAIEFLSKAAIRQPDSVELLMMLAGLQSKTNKSKDAVETYKKIVELSGHNPAIRRQLASSLIDAGEYAEASKVLEELRKSAPDDKDLEFLLGRAQLGSRQFSEAIQTFKSVLEANPDSVEAEFYLGTAYEQSGDPQSAVKIFSGLLSKSSEGDEFKETRRVFQQHLAAAYTDSGEVDKAIGQYEAMAKEENPPKPQTMFLLINAYRLNRQFDKALSLGKREYEKNEKNPNPSPEIGLVYARALADAGKPKEGAEILNKMLQAEPSNIDIYVNLSQVYVQGKKFADAEKILRRAEEKKLDSPDREKVKFQLATVYERQKDFDRAELLFKEILKENPKNATALNYIGYMLADRGVRLQEAVQYVKEALEVEPNNPAYLDSLGWAFFKLNDLQKAEQYLLQAVGLTKNDPTMYDHLGDLYYKSGDIPKALDFWSKSVQNGVEPEETQKVREKLEKLQETLRKQKRRQ